ncbi:type IV secretion system DNA-binding domain-containing protein [Candidatus Gracilibacteria bacterium]|nr:type IV secretion system DNA-binding domain-containing protein [Candidatus Gracilibacteria bacterium]
MSAFLTLFGILFGYLIILYFVRKYLEHKKALGLAFLRVTLPKKDSDLDQKKETTKDFKEMVSLMEQLLASLKSLYSQKILRKILGQETMSLEYITHENEIFFYVVCQKFSKKLIEKQINSFYTDAVIEETREVNIFEKQKYFASTYIHTAKSFAYPIKTYQKLESDPINNITNAFSKLDENQSGSLQIILKPIADSWQGISTEISGRMLQGKKHFFTLNPLKILIGFFDIFFTSNDDSQKSPESSSSALTQDRAKTVDEKDDKTGYQVVIRIITTGESQHDADTELKNIISSFSQFSYPELNKFSPTLYHNQKRLLKNFIYRSFSHPFWLKKMILNTEEISSIFHFPHIRYNQAPEIHWQNFKLVKAPVNIPKEGLLLGENIFRGVKKEIRIKTEDRFRHFYVIGQTGTGKSSILQSMARQDLRNGEGIAIMDPHGDLVKDLLPFVPRERADDVIVFDPSDETRPIGLNLLEALPEERDMVAQDANNMMIKLFGNEIFGPRIQDYFLNGVLTLMEYPQGGALTDIIRLFTDDDFQKDHVRNVKNPIVKAWWEKTFASMGQREKQEIIPFIAAKFTGFITNQVMRNIIGQTKSSFNIADSMQEGKILFLNLSKGMVGDLNSKLLGMIIVSKIQSAAMKRQRMEKSERRDFYLYIDEFQNYVTPSIESILSEARKYRLGLVLAHQYLGQLEQSDALTKSSLDLKKAIFGNVGSVMSYKVGPEDGEFLAKYFQPSFSDADLINMDKFKGVMKLAIDNQPSTPFSIIPTNPYLESGDPKIAKALIELSRLKYGRDKAFVSKEIEYRIGIM